MSQSMSHGAAGTFWEALKYKGNFVQHESATWKGRNSRSACGTVAGELSAKLVGKNDFHSGRWARMKKMDTVKGTVNLRG